MKCPYCGIETEQGYVQSKYGVFWSRKIRKFPNAPENEDGDVPVAPHEHYLYSANGNSFLCRKCGRIIIELNKTPVGKKEQ